MAAFIISNANMEEYSVIQVFFYYGICVNVKDYKIDVDKETYEVDPNKFP